MNSHKTTLQREARCDKIFLMKRQRLKEKAHEINVLGLDITYHPSINLPEERLTAIEKQIAQRTRELLAIPTRTKVKETSEPVR